MDSSMLWCCPFTLLSPHSRLVGVYAGTVFLGPWNPCDRARVSEHRCMATGYVCIGSCSHVCSAHVVARCGSVGQILALFRFGMMHRFISRGGWTL